MQMFITFIMYSTNKGINFFCFYYAFLAGITYGVVLWAIKPSIPVAKRHTNATWLCAQLPGQVNYLAVGVSSTIENKRDTKISGLLHALANTCNYFGGELDLI